MPSRPVAPSVSEMTAIYNGVNMVYAKTVDFGMREVPSPSGRTRMYMVYTYRIRAWILWESNADKTQQWLNIQAALTSRGGLFNLQENGVSICVFQPQSAAGAPIAFPTYTDMLYGPIPSVQLVRNMPLGAEVVFTISCVTSPQNQLAVSAAQLGLPNAVTSNQVGLNGGVDISNHGSGQLGTDIVDNFARATYDIDEAGSVTRTISGELRIGGRFGKWTQSYNSPDIYRLAVLNANPFLQNSILRPPPYCKRSYSFTPMEDGITLVWSITDRQVQFVPPSPASSWKCSIMLHDGGYHQPGNMLKFISCAFKIPYQTAASGGALVGATNASMAQNNNFGGFITIAQKLIINYLYSNQSVSTYVESLDFGVQDVEENIYVMNIVGIYNGSYLYSQSALVNSGPWVAPPNTNPTYNYAMPWGTAGLYGTAYNAQQSNTLAQLYDPGQSQGISNPGGGGLSSSTGTTSQPQILFQNEKFILENAVILAPFTNGSGTIASVVGTEAAKVHWAGYMVGIGAAPTVPLPANYFNVVSGFDASYWNSSTGGASAKGWDGKKWDATITRTRAIPCTPILSRINDTHLFPVKYVYTLLLPPLFTSLYNLGQLTAAQSASLPVPISLAAPDGSIPTLSAGAIPSSGGSTPAVN